MTPVVLVLFFVLLSRHIERPFRLGWSFGFGWFAAGISWVHVSIADFGGLPLVGSLGLMALLCGYLALFPAIFSHLLTKYFTLRMWPLAAPFLWLAAEWLRGWLLTGFPWLSFGYSQLPGPLAGLAPVIGETGISVVLIFIACTVVAAMQAKRYMLAGMTPLLAIATGWALDQIHWVEAQADKVSVAMVQGNIKQSLRWLPEQDKPTMDKYLALTEPYWDSDLIIWPEAAIPKLEPIARKFIAQLDQRAAAENTALITGIVNYNVETGQAYNNLLSLGKQQAEDKTGHYHYGHVNRYAKHHLLPIGEFIPLEDWLRGLAPLFDLPMSSFSRGDYQQANLLANGYMLAPAICFEIAFPRQISANLYEDTDFIITVSNDAWFGRSHGPAQHMQIAQMRAKEFGLPVLRATNNGITGFVDHQGNLHSQLPQFEAGVLRDALTLTRGATPYRGAGDVPVWVITLMMFLAAFRLRGQVLALA